MFEEDPISQYIINLQNFGLEINELRKEHDQLPIEWFVQMIEESIKLSSMYREECESNRKFSREVEQYSKQIARNLGIKTK